jgi:hypothetical protein
LAIIAHAILAILLASAMAATFVGRRASSAVSQGRCPVVPFEAHGERKGEMEEATKLQRTSMHAFLAACIAIIGLSGISYFALSALQQPTGAYTAENVRIDPVWMERSTQLSWTELLPGPESTAVQASIPETSQTAAVAQTAVETVAPKADAASVDPEQVPQSLQALPQTVDQVPISLAEIAQEDANLQASDVEIFTKIPVPRPRPSATSARKSMPVPSRSAPALPH